MPEEKFNKALRAQYSLICRNSSLSIENKVLIYLAYLRPIVAFASPIWGCTSKSNLPQCQALENKTLRMIGIDGCPLLHDVPCLPSDSPVSSAQILLQLINGCEPVTLLLLPQRSIVLCTCLTADSSPPTTVARNQTHLSHGN
ncbi:hypothetical protein AVEN_177126-1 [Araneus ventricosus]|uniref:RNA-directed DNA polymerase from mobile element jockey n=1 Tax=Araneus ventricosus TaxID=182803 RepID=A0A4Y2HLX4_ARAVE|nr:hypothetical protein AVEN_177126-1 [Araneus ventricosus]